MSTEETTREGAGGPMEMGMGMARKMMAQMGKGGPNPMAMMEKMIGQMAEAGQSPPPMMQMCMGMCAEMLGAIRQTSETAAFATPELHQMFSEWLAALEEKAAEAITGAEGLDLDALAAELGISTASTAYLVARLAAEGKVRVHAAAPASPA